MGDTRFYHRIVRTRACLVPVSNVRAYGRGILRTILPLLILTLPLLGCSTAKPYAEVELKYALPFSSDYWVHQDRSWTCEPPQVDLEVGFEWNNGWAGGVYHESFVLCGTFNNKPEIYENGLIIKKKFGGYK